MKSKLESIIRGYNREKKPDVVAKLVDFQNDIFTIHLSGLRPDAFFEDFKSELEEKTRSRLLVEGVEKDDGNRIVRFSMRSKRGPADEILDMLSKYYEGAPPPKLDFED